MIRSVVRKRTLDKDVESIHESLRYASALVNENGSDVWQWEHEELDSLHFLLCQLIVDLSPSSSSDSRLLADHLLQHGCAHLAGSIVSHVPPIGDFPHLLSSSVFDCCYGVLILMCTSADRVNAVLRQSPRLVASIVPACETGCLQHTLMLTWNLLECEAGRATLMQGSLCQRLLRVCCHDSLWTGVNNQAEDISGCVFCLCGHEDSLPIIYNSGILYKLLSFSKWNAANPMGGYFGVLALGRWLALASMRKDLKAACEDLEDRICTSAKNFHLEAAPLAIHLAEAGEYSWISLLGYAQLLDAKHTAVVGLGLLSLAHLLLSAENCVAIEENHRQVLDKVLCLVWSSHRDLSHLARKVVEVRRMWRPLLQPPRLENICVLFVRQQYKQLHQCLQDDRALPAELRQQIFPLI